jgi:hypothetical protein
MSTTNVEQVNPAPPTFNAANGVTSTQEFLQSIAPESAQQGSAALNAPQTFAGVLAPNAVNSYRWE